MNHPHPVSYHLHMLMLFSSSPGSEYVVAGHEDWRTGRLMVNTKSLVKSWRSSLGRKILHILRKNCGQRQSFVKVFPGEMNRIKALTNR